MNVTTMAMVIGGFIVGLVVVTLVLRSTFHWDAFVFSNPMILKKPKAVRSILQRHLYQGKLFTYVF
jgi:hypothetical protein